MGRFRRSHWRQLLAIGVVVVLALLRWWSDRNLAPPSLRTPEYVDVERTVDGDTLLLRDGRWRVRLQGVDSPETVKEDSPVEPWGPEASAFTKAFVDGAGGRVRLEVDGEKLDQFGRRLAFVWHGDRMLNEELVRAGLARARLGYDYSQAKKDRLRRAQRDAQRAKRGIWSKP